MKEESIIKRSYFPGLILSASCIFIIGLLLTTIFMHFELYRSLETHYSAVRSVLTDFKETLIIKTVKINGIFSLLLLAGLTGLGIFYTHRIAGPLHRIKLSAKSISEGLMGTKVKFRRKDVIHPFAESLNKMTGAYSDKLRTINSETLELKNSISKLQSLAEEGKETEAEMNKIINADSRMKEVLKTIKL